MSVRDGTAAAKNRETPGASTRRAAGAAGTSTPNRRGQTAKSRPPAAASRKRPRITREGAPPRAGAPAPGHRRTRSSFASHVKAARKPAPAGAAALRASGGGRASSSAPGQQLAKRTPQHEPDAGFVAVGRVLAPFGLKGELKVLPLTDNPARFRPRAKLWAGTQPVSVAASREAQGYVYITLKGFSDRTSVDRFRHALLQVPESDLPPLAEGEYYRFQLLGLTVVDRRGDLLGTLDEVIETGANDVYRVRLADGSDLLLPAVADVVVSVDIAAKRLVVDPPEWR